MCTPKGLPFDNNSTTEVSWLVGGLLNAAANLGGGLGGGGKSNNGGELHGF